MKHANKLKSPKRYVGRILPKTPQESTTVVPEEECDECIPTWTRPVYDAAKPGIQKRRMPVLCCQLCNDAGCEYCDAEDYQDEDQDYAEEFEYDRPTVSAWVSHALSQTEERDVFDGGLTPCNSEVEESFMDARLLASLNSLNSASRSSSWTLADESMSRCDSDFEVISLGDAEPAAPLRRANSSPDEQAFSYCPPARCDQPNKKRTPEEQLRATMLRMLLKKRFGTVVGHGRGLAEIERVVRVKQRQQAKRAVVSGRVRAAVARAQGRAWGRAQKAC